MNTLNVVLSGYGYAAHDTLNRRRIDYAAKSGIDLARNLVGLIHERNSPTQRLRGQGYGDSPDAVFHSFSTAHINNRLSDTIECSQPLPKNSNPKFSTLSMQKHYPTPEWCAGCSQPLPGAMISSHPSYEVRPRKDRRGFDLICDALPFGRLWYDGPNAISNARW